MDFSLLENTSIRVLRSKNQLKTNLETTLNLGPILERFGYQKSKKIGIKNNAKMSTDQRSLSRPLWRGVGVRPVKINTPPEELGGVG